MPRYRIVIEVDTDEDRAFVNKLAEHMFDEAVTRKSTPAYLSTEQVELEPQILRTPKQENEK